MGIDFTCSSGYERYELTENSRMALREKIKRIEKELSELKTEKSGEWVKIVINKGTRKECLVGFKCSNCGNITHKGNARFCDDCGAKMKKEENQ